MNPGTRILAVSIVMAICSFVAGLLPLIFNLSSSKLSYVSKFSVGLLISTAFILILPEGLEHYLNNPYKHDEPNYTAIGLYLLIGFTTLFLIDQISQLIQSSQGSVLPGSSYSDVTQFEIDTEEPPSTDFGGAGRRKRWDIIKSVFQNTNTLGLIIHSLTDGIALASTILSSTADEPTDSEQLMIREGTDDDEDGDNGDQFKMSLIIIAIFIHKLPTSFALTSLLLLENYNLKEVLYHLGAFSLSAPLGAFITAFLIYFFVGDDSAANSAKFSGPLLLFSGGSFLYVGFHTLIEVMVSSDAHAGHGSKIFENGSVSNGRRLLDNGLLLLGMVVPLFASHVHGGED